MIIEHWLSNLSISEKVVIRRVLKRLFDVIINRYFL